jgi:hydrogenase maturation protease
MAKANAVIALGNPLLCDDSAALVALRMVQKQSRSVNTDFIENYSSGMDLLPELIGREHVILMDAVRTLESEPGTCMEFTLDDLRQTRQARLVDTHGMNLATVVQTGVRFGYSMPLHLTILGIEGRDFTSFQEQPHENVMSQMPHIVNRVEQTILEWESANGG